MVSCAALGIPFAGDRGFIWLLRDGLGGIIGIVGVIGRIVGMLLRRIRLGCFLIIRCVKGEVLELRLNPWGNICVIVHLIMRSCIPDSEIINLFTLVLEKPLLHSLPVIVTCWTPMLIPIPLVLLRRCEVGL